MSTLLEKFQYVERFFRIVLVAILVVEILQMLFLMGEQRMTISELTDVIKTLPCIK